MRFSILSVCLAFAMMSTLVTAEGPVKSSDEDFSDGFIVVENLKGRVKSFDAEVLDGFITADDKTYGDLFFYHTGIKGSSQTLAVGQAVQFDVKEDEDQAGRLAVNVVVL